MRAQLLSPCSEVVAGQTLNLALALEVDAGWHVYWRNPGEAGGPPALKQLGGERPVELPLRFPAPHTLVEGEAVSYGYPDSVTLGAQVLVPDNLVAGDRFRLDLRATWLVCNEVCLAENQALSLDLPVTHKAPALSPAADRVQHAIDALPAPLAGLQVSKIPGDPNELRLELRFPAGSGDPGPGTAYFYCATKNLVRPSAPQAWVRPENPDQPFTMSLPLYRGASLPKVLKGVLTLESSVEEPVRPRLAYTIAAPLPADR